MLGFLKKVFGTRGEVVLVVLTISILVVLFTPIPSALLDFLLLANFSFGLTVLLLTFYMDRPLSFSTFPSLLLIATLFRLSLNLAATRLILSDADAGHVISAIGSYVVGGNYVIGLVIFLILIVVQYVVVTNGAQRVAEVAARFTLDGMPGKQMSIDADLNMGLIDEKKAQQRRKEIEKEANFYGAMDGASKFVKGDAIAGILIILIDIVGGLTIGMIQKGMDWGEALFTYTLLTVGDGIVTQIPALIIATATGLIVTRAATDAELGQEISDQITAYPRTLVMVGVALIIGLFLPGIPAWPLLILLVIAGMLGFIAFRKKPKQEEDDSVIQEESADGEDDLYEMMAIEPIEIAVGAGLVEIVGNDDGSFMERIKKFRKQYAMDMGLVIPKVRLKDDGSVKNICYQVRVYGSLAGEGELMPDRVLAINPGGKRTELIGDKTKDPTYGLDAIWISHEQKANAANAGYTLVDPLTVLTTHFSEVIRRKSSELLTRSEADKMLLRVKEKHGGLVDELIPNVLSVGDVQKVLQLLLKESVSIRNLESILEVLVDQGKGIKDPEVLNEFVRSRLGGIICQNLSNKDNELYVMTLDPSVEQAISAGINTNEGGQSFVIEPKFAEQFVKLLATNMEKMLSSNHLPVLLCSPVIRRHIKGLTERTMPHLSVLSLSEIPNTVSLKSFGSLRV